MRIRPEPNDLGIEDLKALGEASGCAREMTGDRWDDFGRAFTTGAGWAVAIGSQLCDGFCFIAGIWRTPEVADIDRYSGQLEIANSAQNQKKSMELATLISRLKEALAWAEEAQCEREDAKAPPATDQPDSSPNGGNGSAEVIDGEC